jgi:hypothetical protein
MKRRFASIAGTLGCVTLLVVACGGADFEGPSGGDAGATSGGSSSSGAAGEPNAGSDSGGTASGTAGSNSGGSSSGGTASGGTNGGGTAGTSSGGTAGSDSGGTASGGTNSGGTAGTTGGGMAGSGGGNMNPLRCETDTDCVACAYPTAPQKEADCYCASCAGAPLSKSACAANHEAWTKTCGGTPRICPAIACVVPPVPQCKSHMCVAG